MAPRRPFALVVAALALACPKPPPPAPEEGQKPPASVESPAPKPAPKTDPAPQAAPVVGTPIPRWTPPVLDPTSPEAQEIDRLEDLRADPAGRLLALAKDARPEVRARAVLALGRTRKIEYADALSLALADTDPATRRVAAFGASALGDNAPRSLVDALAKTLSAESDAGVASECALALGRVGKDSDAPALLAALEKSGSQVGAALGLGLLAQRNQALPALAEEKLAPLLASPTREARFAGAYALMRAKRVTPALIAASKSESEIDTLAAIARALGSKDEAHGATLDEARQALRPLLENSAWKVRVEAVRSLAKLAPSPAEAVAALDAQISAEQKAFSPSMSAATLHPTLSALEVLDASLSAALESGASVAPLAGVSSLYTYAGDALAKSPSAAQVPGVDAAHCGAATLLDISSPKGPEKVKSCGSKDAAWRRGLSEIKVIQAGRKKDEKAAREALAKLLPSKDARVRAAAIEALGGIPGPEAAGLVRKSLADKDFAVSATAVDAITNRAKAEKPEVDKEAVKPLLGLLDRYPSPSDAEAIIAVYKALAAVADPTDKALPVAIARGLADPNAAVVAAAKDAQKALNVIPATGKIKPLPASKAKGPKAGEAVKVPARGAKAVVTTTQGAFSFELLVDAAPRTAANFASLARAGYFDGIVFHRVVADFVAQGGDPRGDGWGGPGYAIRDENSPLSYETGAVGMALSGPDTGGSQWFIMHGYQPHLDSRYPLFGKIVAGQEVVDSLQVGDKMLSVKISE